MLRERRDNLPLPFLTLAPGRKANSTVGLGEDQPNLNLERDAVCCYVPAHNFDTQV